MLLAVPQESTAALSRKPAQRRNAVFKVQAPAALLAQGAAALTAPLPRHLASHPHLLEASPFVSR